MRGLFILASALFISTTQAESLSSALIENLYAMKSIYRTEYAPAAWKKTYADYDLDVNFQRAIDAASAKPDLNQAQARDILKKFIYAMKDYHTSITFISTESATLPLTIKGAESRFFLAYIDRTKLPESAFPYQVGDEVVIFNGVKTLEAVERVQAEIPENIFETDRALAELALTNRRASRGYQVPQGPITLGIKSQQSNKVTNIQLIWDYTAEEIAPRRDLNLMKTHEKVKPSISYPMMDFSFDENMDDDNPYKLGGRKSFTPDLGLKLWETNDDNTFHAYLYMNKEKKLIGYLRLPSFAPKDYDKAITDFKGIISHLESITDALIIDQVNNPGGSVFYLYSLASMLSDQPLQAPRHRMAITQLQVLDAQNQIAELQKVKNDEEARKLLSQNIHGYPVSYELSQFLLGYYRLIISEWNSGRKLTQAFWLHGADHINPSNVHYTHPILVLTNHLDFSGGDFFPAILKDNKRITILGTRTAGAGGYVYDVQIPNNIGINSFRITESIAERVDGNPIENLGVTPDIVYEMTPEDYQKNFASYSEKIKMTIDSMVK